MKNLFTLLLYCVTFIGFAQIESAEYFIDTDPGTDNGIPITINTPGFSVSESFTINTNLLNNGIHTLYVRTKDANDAWSLYFKQTFLVHDFSDSTSPSQIIAAEYFFDTDPGTDNGTAIAITPDFSVSESLAIPAALSDGIHTLYVRTKDDDDRWSLYFKQTFLVHSFSVPVQTQINKAEYFFDADPGVGLGNEIAITPGFNLNESVNIPSGSLAEGTHYLHIRTRDENGVWSLYEVIEFEVTETLGVGDNLILLTKIYPVPAKDFVTINTNNEPIENVSIYDLNGKLILNYPYHINKINISHLNKGLYLIKVKTAKGFTNKKIIVE